MTRIDLPALKAFVRTLQGQNIETQVQHKLFTVRVEHGAIIVTPLTTNKPRPIPDDQVVDFLELFTLKHSYHPRDYLQETRNASYLLALIWKYSHT